MEVIESCKSGRLIGYSGFLYRVDRKNQSTINWRCVVKGCKGRLGTPREYQEGDIPIERGQHNHIPDPSAIEIKKLQSRVAEQASSTHDPPRRIIQVSKAVFIHALKSI